jgi:hypothetical protein
VLRGGWCPQGIDEAWAGARRGRRRRLEAEGGRRRLGSEKAKAVRSEAVTSGLEEVEAGCGRRAAGRGGSVWGRGM